MGAGTYHLFEILKCTWTVNVNVARCFFCGDTVDPTDMSLFPNHLEKGTDRAVRIGGREQNVGIQEDLHFFMAFASFCSSAANSLMRSAEYTSIGTVATGRNKMPSEVISAWN